MPLFEPSEIDSMAKWFVKTVGAIDQWQDFAQEAHVVLLEKRERINSIKGSRKGYAAQIIWNHWKKMRPKLSFVHAEAAQVALSQEESHQMPDLFYELAVQHLQVMLSMRARLVLRELINPSGELLILLRHAAMRKRRVKHKPVVPLLSAVSQVVGFKISGFVKEIQDKLRDVACQVCLVPQ